MPFNDSIGRGLRGAGSILSSDVYQSQERSNLLRQEQSANADSMVLEQTIKAMSEGRLDPQQGMPLVIESLKRSGASPDVLQMISGQTFGPSIEAQEATKDKTLQERAHMAMDNDPIGQQFSREMFPDAKSRRDAILDAKKTQQNPYDNVSVDDNGNPFGFNKTTGKYERLPGERLYKRQPQDPLANEPLVEIFDAESPTKSRFVPRSQAIGQPGKMTSSSGARPLPPSLMKPLIENKTNLSRAQRALALAEGNKVGTASGDKSATGWKGYLPDAILQRADPEGVDTRAAIGDIGSMVIHDRSGAAVTAAEFPRLRPFIPGVNDDNATVVKKLKRFNDEYQAIVDEMEEVYTDSGYQLNSGGEDMPEDMGAAEDWVSRAMQANPDMTREQIIDEGRKLGKIP